MCPVITQTFSAIAFRCVDDSRIYTRTFHMSGVFVAWGKACLKVGDVRMARTKFEKCMDRNTHFESDRTPNLGTSEQTRRRFSKSSWNLDTVRGSKPTRDPPLLKDIIQILEPMIRTSNLKRTQYHEGSDRSQAMLIRNKLESLNALASRQMRDDGNVDLNRHGDEDTEMSNVFYDECVYYLNNYGSHLILCQFFVKYRDFDRVLRYICDNDLSADLFVEIYLMCLKMGRIEELHKAIINVDVTFKMWEVRKEICTYISIIVFEVFDCYICCE